MEKTLITGLVLDCSIVLSWYLEEEKTSFTEHILTLVEKRQVFVPALWRLEFANALLMAERRRRISKTYRKVSLEHASQLPFRIDETILSLEAVSVLAETYQLTTYDAVYLELAFRKKLTLVTLDQALLSAAKKAKISYLKEPIANL